MEENQMNSRPFPGRLAQQAEPGSSASTECSGPRVSRCTLARGTEGKIAANPYVLQELAKEPGTREHEIISYRRRHLVKPHGYPLSGRDRAGKRVLFHSGEKEKFGAGEA